MPARVKKFFCIFCSLFSFFGHTTPFTPKSGLIGSVKLCFSDHGSLVIFRSASVRPKHLFDPYFDHDYLFKLPFRGSGMPHQVYGVLLHVMYDSELSRVRTGLYNSITFLEIANAATKSADGDLP